MGVSERLDEVEKGTTTYWTMAGNVTKNTSKPINSATFAAGQFELPLQASNSAPPSLKAPQNRQTETKSKTSNNTKVAKVLVMPSKATELGKFQAKSSTPLEAVSPNRSSDVLSPIANTDIPSPHSKTPSSVYSVSSIPKPAANDKLSSSDTFNFSTQSKSKIPKSAAAEKSDMFIFYSKPENKTEKLQFSSQVSQEKSSGELQIADACARKITMKCSEINNIFEKVEHEYLPTKEKKGWNRHSTDTAWDPKNPPALSKPRAKKNTSAGMTELMHKLSLAPVARSGSELTLPRRVDLDAEAVSSLELAHEKDTGKKECEDVGKTASEEQKNGSDEVDGEEQKEMHWRSKITSLK